MKGDDLSERFLAFGARIVKLVDALPDSPSGRHIGLQLLRSGTSAGANYEEARGAESTKYFVHKLGICLKEGRETRYWLNLIPLAALMPIERIGELSQECEELGLIIGKSVLTAKSKRGAS